MVYHSKAQPQAPGCRLCSTIQRSTSSFNIIRLNDPGTGMTFIRILYDVAFGTIESQITMNPQKATKWNSERITGIPETLERAVCTSIIRVPVCGIGRRQPSVESKDEWYFQIKSIHTYKTMVFGGGDSRDALQSNDSKMCDDGSKSYRPRWWVLRRGTEYESR